MLIILFSAISRSLFASTGDTTFYHYVKIGKVVGQEWAVQKEKNQYDFYDEYNDRGRGPAVYTHIQTDDKGVIVSAAYSGVDYHKSTVNEKFTVRGGKAYWTNQFEHDSAVYRGQLYSAMNWSYAQQSLNLRMLQTTAANGEIQLLPSGVLRCRVLATIHLDSLPSLQLVAFTGSGYTPDYLWFKSPREVWRSPIQRFLIRRVG